MQDGEAWLADWYHRGVYLCEYKIQNFIRVDKNDPYGINIGGIKTVVDGMGKLRWKVINTVLCHVCYSEIC